MDQRLMGLLHGSLGCERQGSQIVIQCESEDDAIIFFELLTDAASGKTKIVFMEGEGDTDPS